MTLPCPRCRAPLPESLADLGYWAPCPVCGVEVQCEVFPALAAGPRRGRPGETLLESSEASCFFHAEKRAAVACESCGRFLCALCDLELDGRHLCPSCLSAGRRKGALAHLDRFRLSFSGIALLTAVLPGLAFPLMTFITAPVALVILIVGWRRPPSLTGRRRIFTSILAAVLALGQIVAWVFWGGKMWQALTR